MPDGSATLKSGFCVKVDRRYRDIGSWIVHDPIGMLLCANCCNGMLWNPLAGGDQAWCTKDYGTQGTDTDFIHEFDFTIMAIDPSPPGPGSERICLWAAFDQGEIVTEYYFAGENRIVALRVDSNGVVDQFSLTLIEKGGMSVTMAAPFSAGIPPTTYWVRLYKQGFTLRASIFLDPGMAILVDTAEIILSNYFNFQHICWPLSIGDLAIIETTFGGNHGLIYGSFENIGETTAFFNVRRSSSRNLGAGFQMKMSASSALPAGFESGQDSKDLPAGFNPGQDVVLLPGGFMPRHASDEALLARLTSRAYGANALPSALIIRRSASLPLLSGFDVRHSSSIDLPKAIFHVRHGSTKNVSAAFIARHDATPLTVKGRFAVRGCYPLWTNRRYINGVVEAAEDLIGDAKIELVIEGVMEDIQVWLDAECYEETYPNWVCIEDVPKAIKRATTYGVISALYARRTRTFQSRVIPSVAPVQVTVVGDEERAMLFWQGKIRDMLELYLSAQGATRLWVSTADEEPVFSMEDIPPTAAERGTDTWLKWIQSQTGAS